MSDERSCLISDSTGSVEFALPLPKQARAIRIVSRDSDSTKRKNREISGWRGGLETAKLQGEAVLSFEGRRSGANLAGSGRARNTCSNTPEPQRGDRTYRQQRLYNRDYPNSPLKKSILPASGSCPSWRRPKSSTNQRIRLRFCPCQTEQSLALGDEALLQRTVRCGNKINEVRGAHSPIGVSVTPLGLCF